MIVANCFTKYCGVISHLNKINQCVLQKRDMSNVIQYYDKGLSTEAMD